MEFDGAWDLTVDSPMGAKTFRLEVRTVEGALEGAASMNGESMPLLEPVEKDGHFRWTLKLTRPMNINLAFDVTRSGDLLTGSAKAGFMTLPDVKGVKVG